MADEFRPRPNDHIVEPVFAALRPGAPGEDGEDGEPPLPQRGRGSQDAGLKWKLGLFVLGLLALAWLVKLLVVAA